jgi:hypothetical protein
VGDSGKKLPERLPNDLGAARSRSSSPASETVPELTIQTIYKSGRVRPGKEALAIGLALANQIDGKVTDRLRADKQTDGNRPDSQQTLQRLYSCLLTLRQ